MFCTMRLVSLNLNSISKEFAQALANEVLNHCVCALSCKLKHAYDIMTVDLSWWDDAD